MVTGFSSYVPGKILLSGEHAVVYGYPALVSSIDIGIRVTAEPSSSFEVESDFDDEAGIIEKAMELIGGVSNIKLRVESELPIGSGFGSSAALGAAVLDALGKYLGKQVSKDELYKLTLKCEKVAHGNPSGVDSAAVVYGGLIYFQREKVIERFKANKANTFFVINSGEPVESTKDMVAMVGRRMKREPEFVNKILRQIGQASLDLREALENGGDLEDLINWNGELLEELGVVGKRASLMSREMRVLGFGVKVTGAGGLKGGSGMLLCYHEDAEKLEEFVKSKGRDYLVMGLE